jgi:hypothetical protein
MKRSEQRILTTEVTDDPSDSLAVCADPIPGAYSTPRYIARPRGGIEIAVKAILYSFAS